MSWLIVGPEFPDDRMSGTLVRGLAWFDTLREWPTLS